MSSEVLGGVVGAWSVTHAALGIYFLLAFVLGRREREHLLFSLLCFAFSLSSLGEARDYVGHTFEEYQRSDVITHAGYIAGAALNLHFALAFARVRGRRWLLGLIYGAALMFEALVWTNQFWHGRRVVDALLFGDPVRFSVGVPNLLCDLFYGVGALEAVATMLLLARAFTEGRKEALSALIGGSVTLPAVLNDVGLASGWFPKTVSLLPHAFLIYAFGVASALLLRYRLATRELQSAATRLRERTEELRHSHAELRQIQDELSNKRQLAEVGELAAAIAHEVRNPLAVIVNAVAGLRRGSLRAEDRTTLLDIVEEEAGRLNRLVGDLLRFARPFSISRQPVALTEMAHRFNEGEGESLAVRVDASPDAETVWVDPNLFRLVFDNLISNARQAMRDGGTVNVRIRRDEGTSEPSVRIEIADTGHGMPPDVRRRALDPFYTTRPSGTGLGLPIVQRIVEAHGGWLGIESAEGVGTTVTLHFPVAKPTSPSQRPPASVAS
ncbi:MAG TPA: ATP-binding protein [Polyangiaceae bacterium]|nr:ATP-binding protein [Polyangiaceae bacterium]